MDSVVQLALVFILDMPQWPDEASKSPSGDPSNQISSTAYQSTNVACPIAVRTFRTTSFPLPWLRHFDLYSLVAQTWTLAAGWQDVTHYCLG